MSTADQTKPTRPTRKPSASPRQLLAITNELTRADSLDAALERLVDLLSLHLNAERSTVFLNDERTGELYSRVAQGEWRREIRMLNNRGVAGWSFTTGEGAIIADAYADERFLDDFDRRTGFKTKSILCAPLRNLNGDIVGASQVLNKKDGQFAESDLALLDAITQQAAIGLQTHLVLEQIEHSRQQEAEFLAVVSSVSSEINLGPLLNKIISAITKMLDAERSTLFVNDEKTNELYTVLGEGLGSTQLRLPNHVGIAGEVFQTRKPVNIPHAYADLRFNPSFDKQTGFFTRSILCMPVFNKEGKPIGVTQVLNKRGGPFTAEDEARLSAFTSQISIGVENAKLFDDIQNMKNYNDSVLESMSNAVLTTDQDGKIVTCNTAGLRMMGVASDAVVEAQVDEFFVESNEWVAQRVRAVWETGNEDVIMDEELATTGDKLSVNLTVLPLTGAKAERLGTMLMIEDVSEVKRLKSTMSRYMDPNRADEVMKSGELGGTASIATILFSDIRGFTDLTEELGAQGTVSLLNEYFTVMVECIQSEGGVLDKFVGDAIMAVFGGPSAHEDDPDRALRAALSMMTELATYNARRLGEGRKPVNHGIGLNTDSVVFGNLGSPRFMNYTLIGDGVNVASRLESACKQYGAQLLISELTFRELRATYRTREVDKVVVKGKTEPVGVYEVLDYHTPETFPNMVEALGHFRSGVELYFAGSWDGAIKQFHDALRLHPGDKCARMYVQRCEQLKADPPAQWDGVWVMTSK